MSSSPRIRHAVRVLLVDEHERLLLFRSQHPETGAAFWFPAGGGVEDGEDVRAAAAREVAEETGLTNLELGPEVWQRRHVFTWREHHWDQQERWFLARVSSFVPSRDSLTEEEHGDLIECRWWSVDELEDATERLVPQDLAPRLRELLRDGPPPQPVAIGT